MKAAGPYAAVTMAWYTRQATSTETFPARAPAANMDAVGLPGSACPQAKPGAGVAAGSVGTDSPLGRFAMAG